VAGCARARLEVSVKRPTSRGCSLRRSGSGRHHFEIAHLDTDGAPNSRAAKPAVGKPACKPLLGTRRGGDGKGSKAARGGVNVGERTERERDRRGGRGQRLQVGEVAVGS
jgi:hypothetical protein